MGKITYKGKDITKPFIPFTSGIHAGKHLTKIDYGTKTLTLLQKTLKTYTASKTSGETFSIDGHTIARYYYTTFGWWENANYGGVNLKSNQETDTSINYPDILGDPYYIFLRYARNNSVANERHWADKGSRHILLDALKPYISEEGEYAKFTIKFGATHDRNNGTFRDANNHISTKNVYIRYHNSKLQYKADKATTNSGIVDEDDIKNDWTDIATGYHLTFRNQHMSNAPTAIQHFMYITSIGITLSSVFLHVVEGASWQVLSDMEVYSYK